MDEQREGFSRQIHGWTMRMTDVSKSLVDICTNKDTDLVDNMDWKIEANVSKLLGKQTKVAKINGW